MNSIRKTVIAVVAAIALSFVAACGDLEGPVEGVGNADNNKSESPAPKGPVRTDLPRLDFGDGEATIPAKPDKGFQAFATGTQESWGHGGFGATDRA